MEPEIIDIKGLKAPFFLMIEDVPKLGDKVVNSSDEVVTLHTPEQVRDAIDAKITRVLLPLIMPAK